jgi:predicted metal-binding protein/ubiquinone/menaquinone biosynthesis C-methylase UbiE
LGRFLAVLVGLGLVVEYDGAFANGTLADMYLTSDGKAHLGNFVQYRRYSLSQWQRLSTRVREGISANERPVDEPKDAYQKRVRAYVEAMDEQAVLKSGETLEYLENFLVTPPERILDIGGGAGAWCRTLLKRWPQARTVLFDLPEVMVAVRSLYPDPGAWAYIERVAGDVLHPCIKNGTFDLVILSNILHVYSEEEATMILETAARCLRSSGTVLVHDYLVDEHNTDPLKGRLYDLHMMLNTYNGRIYDKKKLTAMLETAGLGSTRTFQLCSDTWVILAQHGERGHGYLNRRDMLTGEARRLGFCFSRVIKTQEVCVRSWVRLKCRFGCPLYGFCHTCPPHAPDEETMKKILLEYTHALLVQGIPPAKRFHDQLLELERHLFLAGYTKALAFGAGPCPVCPECVTDDPCRFPEKARPSLEASGVDVYTTAERAGLKIKPVGSDHGYVKYVGLVLID